MKKMKTVAEYLSGVFVWVVALVLGATYGVTLAAAPHSGTADLPDAGVTKYTAGETDGIATRTTGDEIADPEFYEKSVSERVLKIRPQSTPIDQISRYAKSKKINSFIVKYYSVGTRPIKTILKKQVTKQSDASTVTLEVEDPSMFTVDDTIRVVGVKAEFDERGLAYNKKEANTPELVLHVVGRDTNTSHPVVYAVNGLMDTVSKQSIVVPEIPKDTVLVRMGKACSELDVQTGRFANIPTPEEQYCQNFMIQVEQSTFDKIAKKEVNWTFSDLEEDGIFDMRLAQENTWLFGAKNRIKHTSKEGMETWFTGGIWNMAGKDIEVGVYDNAKNEVRVSDEDLVDISKDLFVGSGSGDKSKVLLCGSDMLAALSKIDSEKFRLKESVEAWNLKFKSWETDFGEILTIHHELFDLNGMSDCGFALDPSYLSKAVHVSWSRNVLDLKSAGVRNTDAVVLQEVAGLYLRMPNAHARMRLAQKA